MDPSWPYALRLGLGGIPDSFSDLLFPGTSTIQTRLRYFLFILWIYRDLEERQVPSRRIANEARARELALAEPLLSAEQEGVFTAPPVWRNGRATPSWL